MIATRVLGLILCASLAACADPQRMEFADRAPLHRSLVLGGGSIDPDSIDPDSIDPAMYLARNDGRLGAVTESYRRVSEEATVYVYDRLQTVNGRPNNLYWSVTRTNERLER